MPSPVVLADADAVRAELASARFHVSPLQERYRAVAIASGRDIWFDPIVLRLRPPEQTYIIGHELWHLTQQRLGASANAPIVWRGLTIDPALEMEAHQAGSSLLIDMSAQRELPGLLRNAPYGAEPPPGNRPWIQPTINCTFEIDLSNVRIAHIEIGARPQSFTGLGAQIETQKGDNVNHIVAWDLIQKGLRRTLKGKTLREVSQWLDDQSNWWDQSKPKGGAGIGRFQGFAQFRGEGRIFGDLLEVVDDAMNQWILNAYSWNMNLWAGPGKENQAKGRLFAEEKARIKRILSQDCYLKEAPCWLETELRYEARDVSGQRFVPVILEDANGHTTQDNTGQQSVPVGKLADGGYLVKTLYPTHKIRALRYHPTGNAGIIHFAFPDPGVGAFAFTKITDHTGCKVSIYRVSRSFNVKDALAFEKTKTTEIQSGFFGGKQIYKTPEELRNSFIQHVIDIPPLGHQYWGQPGVDLAFPKLKEWAMRALADGSTTVPRFGNPSSRFG